MIILFYIVVIIFLLAAGTVLQGLIHLYILERQMKLLNERLIRWREFADSPEEVV